MVFNYAGSFQKHLINANLWQKEHDLMKLQLLKNYGLDIGWGEGWSSSVFAS